MAVFFALQCVASLVRTETVVVAAQNIAQGQRITAAALTVMEVPAASTNERAYRRVEDAGDGVARVAIARGQPVFSGMVSRVPVPPEGSTTVEVRLASMPERLTPGDVVDLVSSGGCGGAAAGKPCTLAKRALTLSVPVAAGGAAPDGTEAAGGTGGASGLFGSGDDGASRTVAFALTPQEALAVLSQQEAGPLLAIVRPAREVR